MVVAGLRQPDGRHQLGRGVRGRVPQGGFGFDSADAYAAAVKNATVTPPNQNVGRKGLASSIFKGYTPSDATGEAMSWAMDGYINDFGIANMAAALAEKTGDQALPGGGRVLHATGR